MDRDKKTADKAARAEFARRLSRILVDKGFSQADLARACQKINPHIRIERDTISTYVRGIALPSPSRLVIIARALDVAPLDLLPDDIADYKFQEPTLEERTEFREMGDGTAYLNIQKKVPTGVALQVMALLTGTDL